MSRYVMPWLDWTWSVVSKVILDGINAQYLADFIEESLKII